MNVTHTGSNDFFPRNISMKVLFDPTYQTVDIKLHLGKVSEFHRPGLADVKS